MGGIYVLIRIQSYGDLERRTRRLAIHLVGAGIGKGHFVAVVLGRCPQAVESMLATTRSGAVVVPLDPRSPPSELARVLEHSGACVVITDINHFTKVRAATKEGSMIILNGEQSDHMDPKHQVVSYQDWVEDNECLTLSVNIDKLEESEEAFLNYTSGTTGLPKGILMDQKSYLLSARSLVSALGLTPNDQIFWPLPLFHCFGLVTCIFAVMTAGASAYLPGADQELYDSLKIAEAQGASPTVIVGAPTTFQTLLDTMRLNDSISSLSLPRLRLCVCGGSPASTSLGNEIERFLGVPLSDNYGCAEGLVISVCKPDHIYRQQSSMTLLPQWKMKLVDSDGKEVKDGEQGELLIQGPTLMLRYHRDTQNPFVMDGWYATGDIAKCFSSASGMDLALIGRKKEIIIRGGENIYPHELERVLLRHPSVTDAVVASIPHRLLGEVPAAFIVRGTIDLDITTLLTGCREVLPDYKVPTAFYEIERVPRTFLGKPKRLNMSSYTNKPLTIRYKLQSKVSIDNLVIAETVGASATDDRPEDSESRVDWLHRHFDQPFSDLGLTSMASVVLRDRLSNLTGLSNLSHTLVFDHTTPAAVSQHLCSLLLKHETTSLPRITPNTTSESAFEPIAIVSMACRYPGGVSSPEDLWRLVIDEIDATSDFPDDRGWDTESIYNVDPDEPRTSTTKRGGFLPNFAHFDAGLFGMAPKEALATDPQQRLLLETAWELAERGGIAPSSLRGTQTGVFVGAMYEDYAQNGTGNHELEAYLGFGSSSSVISGRLSYCLNLHGPSLAVATGCSSSLVAMHLAAQSLRNEECTLAIAGGVTTMATPQPFIMLSRRRGLSSDGRCRAYSSDATGTGWSEGVGLVLLERLSDAKRNGHHILGLIRGSAINSDGKSNGLTAPNGLAQEMCIKSALNQARLSTGDVDVIEGHGSGTPLGDTIEVQALTSAYGNGNGSNISKSNKRTVPLLLGSIKSNIGHTQAAAGIASIIKMVQSIRYGVAPASLHIREPLIDVGWEGSGVEVLRETRQWPTVNRPRRAAVSSFGIGGTNSHIILEQPEIVQAEVKKPKAVSIAFPWILSGASMPALRAQARKLLAACRQVDLKSSITIHDEDHADIAFTLATARSALQYRATVKHNLGPIMGNQIQTALECLIQSKPHRALSTSHASTGGTTPRLAYIFSGQGSKLPNIEALQELRATFSAFSQKFDAACGEVNRHLECPILYAMSDSTLRDRTDFAQASLFVFEVAMFHLLQFFNVRPDVVAGHSLGEIVAAHVAGALSLRDAAFIVTTRAKLVASLPPQGGMVSISATEQEALEELVRLELSATVAAVNSPSSIVASGTQEAIKTLADRFSSLGRRVKIFPNVRYGFHSPMMDPILNDFEKALVSSLSEEISSTLPLVSTVTAKRADANQLSSPRHWVRHMSEPVRFADAMKELEMGEQVSVFMEIGPSAVLCPHVPGAIATYDSVEKLVNTLGDLWARGVPVNWQAVFDGSGVRLVDLPVYAFQRQKYWLPYTPLLPAVSQRAVTERLQEKTMGASGFKQHGFILNATSISGTKNVLCSGYLSTIQQPWLRDHIFDKKLLIPATVFVELAIRAAEECLEYPISARVVLDEMTITTPLALSLTGNEEDSEVSQVQIIVREPQPSSHGKGVCRNVEIYSRSGGAATDQEWTHHATGDIIFTSPTSNVRRLFYNGPEPTKKDSDVDISEAYASLKSIGIEYGPSFQGVRAIWHLPDDELLAQIDPPRKNEGGENFILHPVLLDAVLHASALGSPNSINGSNIRLPFSFRGIEIFEPLSTSRPVLVHIRRIDESRLSLTIANNLEDTVAVRIDEIVLRRWQPEMKNSGLYCLQWTEMMFKPSPTIDPNILDSIFRFESCDLLEESAPSDTVHQAVAQALRIVQEWRTKNASSAGGEPAARLVFVTKNATSAGKNLNVNIVTATVWGFVRSVQAEFGQGQVILVDSDGSPKSQGVLSHALATGVETMALREGKISTPSMTQIPAPQMALPMALDVSGTVLITGGMGGLGAILSKDLVLTHGVKNLLLISRSGISAEASEARKLYHELRGADADVRVEACDVGDRTQLAALLENHGQHPPITAVIHCAGVVDDAVVMSQTTQRVSRVLHPKVNGAWNLHELMPNTVRSFILFSSFVGTLGNEGQAAYTAGNAFLDSLARFRVARGLPALSLAWGPWTNAAGMAGEGKLPNVSPRLSTAQFLTDKQGLDLFYKALATQIEVPSDPVLMPLLLSGAPPRLLSTDPISHIRKTRTQGGDNVELAWRRILSNASVEDHPNVLVRLVRDEIAEVLGYQCGDAVPDKPLAEIGFDSSTSVMLMNRLRILTGLYDLPVTLAMDLYSPESLVQYLLPLVDVKPRLETTQDSDISSDICNTPAPSESGEEFDSNIATEATSPARQAHDDVNANVFRGLTTLHERLCKLGQYTSAASLLAVASLTIPNFSKAEASLSAYAASPEHIAKGPFSSYESDVPFSLVCIAPFLPRVKSAGVNFSVYSNIASAMNGERDIFELAHPHGQIVPLDFNSLIELHVQTIRKHFSHRKRILISGYSVGGIVAHAVASKLAETEDQPLLAGIILIDTYPNMTGQDDPDWLNALPAEALKDISGGLVGDLALAKMGGYFKTLQDWDVELFPLPKTAPALFIRARDPAGSIPTEVDLWRPQWPRANLTVEVPGNHLTLLDKKHAGFVVDEIQRWIKGHVNKSH
ncbi:unnamed protein product [Periconia digitata]|uniref:Polyketide synthase n=1 Tax=Periconia digitata TaxID=1303443 RepID=A0A9W4UK19_9PLEO|nr:unnamed protein product [Periconia digitata]